MSDGESGLRQTQPQCADAEGDLGPHQRRAVHNSGHWLRPQRPLNSAAATNSSTESAAGVAAIRCQCNH